MNKYKVGDKIVLTVTDTNEMGCLPCYVLNDDLILSRQDIDKYTEPLSTYTEPLEAKIRRQAAEITRLLRENKELKNEKQELTRERNQLMGRCGGLSAARIKEFNNGRLAGRKEAWELAKKIYLSEEEGGYDGAELFEIFNAASLSDIYRLTYPEAAAKVEAWEKAKEKSQKTMMQDFLEKYPKAYINPLGAPPICPHNLGYKKQNCVGDCLECWSRPLEQIGGEE